LKDTKRLTNFTQEKKAKRNSLSQILFFKRKKRREIKKEKK